ncbi:MAG TPA: T9SS type A sorting domain-containing protein [Ignavibacteria bacterium]|nr:T9SS type A sorting domain-containing protein [Ignavibacteria bacterium]
MTKKINLFIYIVIFISFLSANLYSQQSNIYDDFSKKALPNWVWGGMEMKYSHDEDNKENGFAEIFSLSTVKPNTYIGKIEKIEDQLYTAGNFVNLMLKGAENDCKVKVTLIYDVDNNNTYNDDQDILLEAKPISIDFKGWKEVKFKLDEETFKLISAHNDDFSVTEEPAFALRVEFESGSNYKESVFNSGIALVSEIVNTENLTSNSENTTKKNIEDTFFKAKNFPNPFNPTTKITFFLPESSNVTLTVYDRIGREVQVVLDQSLSAGEHTVDFNGSGLPSGIYFYRIKSFERTEVFKMMMAK